MSENFQTAIVLLIVGMITIFVVLSLVVLSGNALIRLVNRYFPEHSPPKPAFPQSVSSPPITSNTLAAIVAAVDIHTGGKGKITSIEKKS
ncbi:MAG: OadG family protein [Bacteroidia bacterium]